MTTPLPSFLKAHVRCFFHRGTDLVPDARPPLTQDTIAPHDDDIGVCVQTPRDESASKVACTKVHGLAKPFLLCLLQLIDGPLVPSESFQNSGPHQQLTACPTCLWMALPWAPRHSKNVFKFELLVGDAFDDQRLRIELAVQAVDDFLEVPSEGLAGLHSGINPQTCRAAKSAEERHTNARRAGANRELASSRDHCSHGQNFRKIPPSMSSSDEEEAEDEGPRGGGWSPIAG